MKKHLLIPVFLIAALLVTGICMPKAAAAQELNGIYAEATAMTAAGVFAGGGTITANCPYCGTEEQWESKSLQQKFLPV